MFICLFEWIGRTRASFIIFFYPFFSFFNPIRPSKPVYHLIYLNFSRCVPSTEEFKPTTTTINQTKTYTPHHNPTKKTSFLPAEPPLPAAVQLAEARVLAREQGVRAVELAQLPVVQHGDLVEVDDGLELVRHGDDGVPGELLADDALDEGVGGFVDAVFFFFRVSGYYL